MEEIKIVDNFMDKREFRNYINTLFYKRNYSLVGIDDVRVCDDDCFNDNDLIVMRDGVKYTVQTYLNINIGEKQLKETLRDMKHEGVSNGIIVSNFYVDDSIKRHALGLNIVILDRAEFEDGIYD